MERERENEIKRKIWKNNNSTETICHYFCGTLTHRDLEKEIII